MIINIDSSAGFCWGVVQTIDKVERTLGECSSKQVYVLGQIIHNPKESERLAEKGLQTITREDFDKIDQKNSVVVIRAHGEPPTTYEKARESNIQLIDATCPLVKALQMTVKKFYDEGWQIVIFGKHDHAEVIGLRGVCNDKCLVVKSIEDVKQKIDINRKTVLISQTTMDKPTFCKLSDEVRNLFKEKYAEKLDEYFITKNTICKFVSRREQKLIDFAKQHELVIFVAGRNSSNGKILYEIANKANPNTIFIEDIEELKIEELSKYSSIGITGATSTPQWYMEKLKDILENKFNKGS
jgi:4-hydroxy-3-methylbut-2-enyl diphosphate reductase